MKAIQLASFGIIPAALFIAACGDDVTKVTNVTNETSGMEIVASADSLGKCTPEISGEMKFATKENAVYVCADSAWKNVSETEKTSCSAEALSDGSGFKIVCNGDSIGVVKNGADGTDGKNCELSDNGDGSVKVKCGESSSTLYKAFCGRKLFNPDSSFCSGDSIIPLCGGENYDLDSSFCLDEKVYKYKTPVWNLMNPEIEYDLFVDSRDGQVYRSVKIGEQTWMAENLNYAVDSSYCYNDSSENCQKYGRLYETVDITKSVCPEGWHFPEFNETETLIKNAGTYIAGRNLKAQSGWAEDGNGKDALGFSALPGGMMHYNGSFSHSTQKATFMFFHPDYEHFGYLQFQYNAQDYDSYTHLSDDKDAFSVRCVKD